MIAAVTSVVVTGLSLLLGDRQQRRREERSQRQDLNARYLNPLRFHLVESHYRLADTLHRVDAGGGRCDGQLSVSDPAEISGKDADWFNGAGCALASWLYLTACLFAQLKKVRDDFPTCGWPPPTSPALPRCCWVSSGGIWWTRGSTTSPAQHRPVDVG